MSAEPVGDLQNEIVEIGPQPGPQTQFLSTPADVAIYGGAAGGGKLLPIDTPIPTPDGWASMGDLKAGSFVYDENGHKCVVIVAHPIEPMPELYRLYFDDGTHLDACVDHLWLTYTAKDLATLTRKTPEFRAKRREQRPSKAWGNKSAFFSERVAAANRARKPRLTEKPSGSVRTTREIVETLRHNGRSNHAIPVLSAPLETPDRDLPIDPYLLGLWLGDGTTVTGMVTTADSEMAKSLGWEKVPSAKYGWRVPGLTLKLKKLGVLGNKHIPSEYLRASPRQRLELLKGLMDSDGTTPKTGSVEFNNSNERLTDGVIELACSLGHKPGSKISGLSWLKGVPCKISHSVKWTPHEYVFKLERKRKNQRLSERRVTRFRYIVDARPIPSRPGRCISVSSESRLYLAGERMIPTHNSYALLLEMLRHWDNKNFGAVIFRRNATQHKNQGGLWDESQKLYGPLGARPRTATLEWLFPSGGKVKFAHLEAEKSVQDWQGSQIPVMGFDELTHFSRAQFLYMLSRSRSAVAGFHPYIRATCNPDVDSWVRAMIDWWIDEEGYPIPERSGVLRYFINVDDAIVWADSAEEIAKKYAHLPQANLAKSFTFIPSKVFDNQILLKNDPTYLANLYALSKVDRLRLLGGNWNVRASAGLLFKKEWFPVIDAIPAGWVSVIRFWDRAATVPTPENPDPDWTRGLLLYRYADGRFVVGDLKSIRATPGQVEALIRNVASHDGHHVRIMSQQDPGSAGKTEGEKFVQMLPGYDVRLMTTSKDKVTRAKPVSAQAEVHNVHVLRAPWNAEFFAELENFPEGAHDDIVDVLSGAFNEISGAISIVDLC